MISNSPQAKSQYNPHYLYNIILFFPDLCRSLLRQFVFLRAPREKAIMVVRAEPLKIAKKLPLSFCLMLVNILLREKHRTPPLSLRICKISRSVFALRSFFAAQTLLSPNGTDAPRFISIWRQSVLFIAQLFWRKVYRQMTHQATEYHKNGPACRGHSSRKEIQYVFKVKTVPLHWFNRRVSDGSQRNHRHSNFLIILHKPRISHYCEHT